MQGRGLGRWVIVAAALAVVVACGGQSSGVSESPGSGGSSGAGSGGTSSGGSTMQPPLADCSDPLPVGTPCSEEGAHCGGPCSNSWQADNVCKNGEWDYSDVKPCGPHTSTAPECRNAFAAGELTPCCPTGGLNCIGKPDDYPGFSCTPGDDSFCSCRCWGGEGLCGC